MDRLAGDVFREVLVFLHATEIRYVMRRVSADVRAAAEEDFLWELLFLRDASHRELTIFAEFKDGKGQQSKDIRHRWIMANSISHPEAPSSSSSSSSVADLDYFKLYSHMSYGLLQTEAVVKENLAADDAAQLSLVGLWRTQGKSVFKCYHDVLLGSPEEDGSDAANMVSSSLASLACLSDLSGAFDHTADSILATPKKASELDEEPRKVVRRRRLEILPDTFMQLALSAECRRQVFDDFVFHFRKYGTLWVINYFFMLFTVICGFVLLLALVTQTGGSLSEKFDLFGSKTIKTLSPAKFNRTEPEWQQSATVSFARQGKINKAWFPVPADEIYACFSTADTVVVGLVIAATKLLLIRTNYKRYQWRIKASVLVNLLPVIDDTLFSALSGAFVCYMGPDMSKLLIFSITHHAGHAIVMLWTCTIIAVVVLFVLQLITVKTQNPGVTWRQSLDYAIRDMKDTSKVQMYIFAAPCVLLLSYVLDIPLMTPLIWLAYVPLWVSSFFGAGRLYEKIALGRVSINQEWCGDEWALFAIMCVTIPCFAAMRTFSHTRGAWNPMPMPTEEQFRGLSQKWCGLQAVAVSGKLVRQRKRKNRQLRQAIADGFLHVGKNPARYGISPIGERFVYKENEDRDSDEVIGYDLQRRLLHGRLFPLAVAVFCSELVMSWACVSCFIQTESFMAALVLRVAFGVVMHCDDLVAIVGAVVSNRSIRLI